MAVAQFVLGLVAKLCPLWTIADQFPLSMRFSGKNTGVGCHFLLQENFPTHRSSLHFQLWQVDSLPLSHLRNLYWTLYPNENTERNKNREKTIIQKAWESLWYRCDPCNWNHRSRGRIQDAQRTRSSLSKEMHVWDTESCTHTYTHHTHTHTYTHIHTYIHTYTYTHTHLNYHSQNFETEI